jgi:beta-barrel assembly-enhancing protease
MLRNIKQTAGVFTVLLALIVSASADRTTLRPNYNLFSPEQDVELGRELAWDADGMLTLVDDPAAKAYIDRLGNQVAATAPGQKFTYEFKIVDDNTLNSFALPGGIIYVNRRIIEAAQSEAQLAGLLAHQIAHVSMRHTTSQLSREYDAQFSSSSTSSASPRRQIRSVQSIITELGIKFSPDANLFEYSREAERQADLAATQMLYDSGFDPRQMAQFFQRLQTASGARSSAFISDHPAPANRLTTVRNEIDRLGGLPDRLRADSRDFYNVKNILGTPGSSRRAGTTADDRNTKAPRTPSLPSRRVVSFNGRDLQFEYPDNWRVQEDENAITVAPEGGIVSDALAYGMSISTFRPHGTRLGQSLSPPAGIQDTVTLDYATTQLIDELRRSNPNMRVMGDNGDNHRTRVDGEPALITEITNDSPLGGKELDWVVTVLRPDGLLYYFIGVAPERDFDRYVQTFQNIIASVRFNES